MKRMSVTSALTVAGVLTAGSAAALVNTRVLDSSEGQTVQANRVQLVEAQVWEGPPMASPQLPTTIPTTDPSTTTTITTDASAVTSSGSGGTDAPADPAVNDHDDPDSATSARPRERRPADAGETTGTVATLPATTPSGDEQVTGTLPPPYPAATTPTPTTSIPPTTMGSRPRPPTTSTTAPPVTPRPSPSSTTTSPTTTPPDD